MYGKTNSKPEDDRSTERSRLGIHNDCFLANDKDQGTFADESERMWLEVEGLSVMVGGESCEKNSKTGCSEARKQIGKQRFSYLNSEFNEEVRLTWAKSYGYEIRNYKICYF